MFTQWLGVDTGGTFTDFVYFDGASVSVHKVLSTPDAPEQAILQGIRELQLSVEGLQLIHGSTVATNAVLEGKGVKTVYVTNTGFADVLTIGRQAREELYNLVPVPRAPLICAAHCLELNTRLSAAGEVLQSLKDEDIEALAAQINAIKPDAVAVNLLFSFLDDSQEQKIKNQLQEKCAADLFISCSAEILPEYKEYERGMATTLNAYVGPLMQGYLKRLSQAILNSDGAGDIRCGKLSSVSVLQSAGGTINALQAGNYAVNLLLSGPAGGLKAAQYISALTGEPKLLSFDMGGTSTDVALMDGEIQLTSEGSIGGYPVAVPMVDMHTIGAGGGSIASLDAGGLLNVGPESAGAKPGPACYGQGGVKPTVTDANLVLGRLRSDGFLDKELTLDSSAAKKAVKSVADSLSLSVEAAAEGIIRVANEHMVRALRTISVQRGYDPADFVLTCFGGAGGLHVCALADTLKMRRAIVPVHGGVLSALGMLVAAPARELSHSCVQSLQGSNWQRIEQMFAELELRGVKDMQQELSAEPIVKRSVDLRYKGQSFTLNVPCIELSAIEELFHKLHKKTYGHELDMPVELVNLRLSITGQAAPFKLPLLMKKDFTGEVVMVKCYGYKKPVSAFYRNQLVSGQKISGPALILEKVSTTLIDAEWFCVVDEWGNLLLERI